MWQDGYVTEIDYSYGYYSELNPARLGLAATLAGIDHTVPDAPTYLELGFGQGISINIHAAARPGTFWGNDFNPAHASYAQGLAHASGSGATLLDASFAELAAREDLPEFDIIALHGIWSWISDENRAHIIDIARRRLRPGGLFYVSYNTSPGQSPIAPLRHLIAEHSRHYSSGSMTNRVDAAFTFVKSLADADAAYFRIHPSMKKWLERASTRNHNYLAHEYLNAAWEVMPFSKTAGLLAEAKLDFAGSAHLLDQVNQLNFSKAAQEVLNGIDNPELQQTVQDYFINQTFRRDVFVKGRRHLSKLEQARRIKSQRFVLLKSPGDQTLKTKTPLGELNLSKDIYTPIAEVLAEDEHRPKTIPEMAEDSRCAKITYPQFVQALTVMCCLKDVAPTQDPGAVKSTTKSAQALNTALCAQAETSGDVHTLAAPLTGEGVTVTRFEQLFLRALETKQKDVPAWVWSILKQQGQRLVEDGKKIEKEADNLAKLRESHDGFCAQKLPILKRLGVTSAKHKT